jgi:hypothetical protein
MGKPAGGGLLSFAPDAKKAVHISSKRADISSKYEKERAMLDAQKLCAMYSEVSCVQPMCASKVPTRNCQK